jgi:hypothetical protein
MKLFPALVPALLLAAASAAGAAEPPAFGLQAAVAFPANDLTDVANLGIQFGGHGRWDFGHGHGLMGRADLTFYGSKDGASTDSIGAGADYTYHFDHNRRGVYLLAGVTFMNYSVSYHGTHSHSGLGPDVGVGYDVDGHLGLQIRLTSHDVDHSNLYSLNLGATYTF